VKPAVAAWQAACSKGASQEAGVSDSEQNEVNEVNEVTRALAQWNLDLPTVRTLVYRDPHTIGESRFCRDGPASITFEQGGGSPPP
jgi:hypothetical protein